MSLSIGIGRENWSTAVTLSVGESGGVVSVELDSHRAREPGVQLSLDVPFPYHGDQQRNGIDYVLWFTPDGEPGESPVQLTWNGINVGIGRDDHGIDPVAVAHYLTWANSPNELARGVGFVPLKRGFATPVYGVSNVTPYLATDVEVASLLATDRYLEYAVSERLESIADRQIRARMQVGTSSFNLDSIPRNGGVPVSMVNEGFGINSSCTCSRFACIPRPR